MIENSDNVSQQLDVEEQTELMYKDDTIWTAVFNADKNAIEGLINNDPNVINTRGAVGECPIHMLFLYGSDAHLEIAQDLILRYPTIVTQIYNKPVYYGENILHISIVKRNPAMVEWLLGNEQLEHYRERLLSATATGDFFKIGQPSYYGESPLGFACCTNQWDIVEILLKYGAGMNTTDSNGNTILHMLVICSLPEIYAKFKARWIEKQTPAGITDTVNNQLYTLKTIKKEKLWNRLNNDNLTPLTLAADLSRGKMLSWLLSERKIVQWSYGDVSCILHPLDQLDLDFQKNDKQNPLCVLEVIIKNNDTELIHPILTSLIDQKWKHFVYRSFSQRFIFTFMYLLTFLATTILEQSRTETSEDPSDEINTKNFNRSRYMLCSIGHTIGSIFLENCLACSFCVCIIIAQMLRLCGTHNDAVLLAFASLLGWGYMFFFIMPFRFTGPFVIMIYKMLFNDVLRFLLIYIIFLAGFSQSFFILFNENGFLGYMSSLKHCFLGLLGDFDLDYYTEGSHPFISVSFLMCYIIVVTILLLNLLIAMMGDTYADVKRSAKKLWHLERARIALDVESSMSTSERKLKAHKYWVEVQGERYLQVEQVNNELFKSKDEEEDEND
ncbi:unnamed protein product [Adineta steineri]|uniref:Ion transport domain-containing protein n=1 Tax=Adineta steineri TaxID=433720 RepID=A0A819AQG5_9BILA|nr:unnamed protein product [Adineta steineri]